MTENEEKICYFELVRAVTPIVYSYHKKPIIADYEEEVAKLMNRKFSQNGKSFNKREVHPTVYRKIKWLTEHGEMITDGKKHYWGLEEYEHYRKLDTFNRTVGVMKDTIGIISGTTYAVLLDPKYNMLESKAEIEKKLGSGNFYATFLLDNVLVIVFNDNNCAELVANLVDAIKEAYNCQHITAKKDG